MSTMYDAKNDRYLELVMQFPLRPIRSETELDEAIRMVDSLLAKKSMLPEEEDYLDVLGDLVKRYESDNHPMPPLSDADMLNHLLEARCISQSELARAVNIADSIISNVLCGKSSLNRDQLGRIAHFFKVSPNVFAF
jgi:HTH-type transcriptional regulator / antitoxin HigA